jgi:nucleoside-diphosphate-sugar epimerase
MRKQVKRVLVLGATGHIGQAVVRHALKQGRQVTALTRRTDPEPLRGLGVNVVRIESDLRSLAEVAAEHDLLVDAAAPYPLAPSVPGDAQWTFQVDAAVRRMKVVIDAARRNRMQLAHVSSCTTLPRHESPNQSAAALWRRYVTPYFEAKAAMEHAVVAAAREGLPAIIVNPAASLGPWEFRAVGDSFVRLVMEQSLPMVINQMVCIIDVREVAEAIDRALAQEMYGRPIPLSGHNIGVPELAMLTAQLAGIAQPVIPLDPGIVSAWVFWMQRALMFYGFTPPTPLNFILLIADAFPMQRSPEQMALGVEIRPLQETLQDAIAFHRSRAQ